MKFVGDDQSLQTTYPMRFEMEDSMLLIQLFQLIHPVPYVKSHICIGGRWRCKNAPLLRLVKDGNDYKLQMGVDGHADANITLENLRVEMEFYNIIPIPGNPSPSQNL